MALSPLGKEPFSAALPPPGQCRTAALGPHPRPKSVLAFAGAL